MKWPVIMAVLATEAAAAALLPKLSWVPGDPATPVVAPGRNVLDNSSFEQGMGGWSTSGSESCDREAEEGIAWHGAHACRMYQRDERAGSLTLASPIFRAEEGQEYSLSCYARAVGEGVTLALTLYNTQWAVQFSASAALNAEWQRIQATGRVGPTRRQTYFALISVNGLRRGNDAWVDAVQVEWGPVTPYRPSGEVELGAVTDRFAHVFFWGEPIVLRPVVANWGPQARRASLRYSLCDYTGAEVRKGELEVQAPPGRATRGEVPVGADWRGYGQALFDLTLPGEEGSLRYRCHFASIPRRTARGFAPDPFFGVHGAGRFARNWELLEAVGCEIAKVYFGWSNQARDGSCDFTGIDEVVSALRRHHIVPIVCLGTWAPGWAEKKNADGTPSGELDLEAWERYVRDSVTHLKDVCLFESWNEIYSRGPTPDTLELMWTAHALCKRLRPEAVMMTNAIAGVGCGDAFLQAFYRARRGRPLDATSLHYPWDSFQQSSEQGRMRALLAATRRHGQRIAGCNPDLYITESGFHPGEGMHAPGMAVMESDFIEGIFCTPRQKADWMVQAFLIVLEHRVRAHCEFDWCGYAQGPPWYSSLTFNDMSPTPALAAYAVMTHFLRGAKVVKAWPSGRSPVRGLILKRGAEALTCLWTAAGPIVLPVRPKRPDKVLHLTDLMGRERTVPVRAGVAVVTLDEGPVYLRGAVAVGPNPVAVEHPPSPWVEGREYRITGWVTNPFSERRKFSVSVVGGQGWTVTPASLPLSLPGHGRGPVRFRVRPAGAGRGAPFCVQCQAAEGTFAGAAQVDLIGAESAALAERTPVVGLADFEGDLSPWEKQVPEGATLEMAPTEEVARQGQQSLRLEFTHSKPTGTWASALLPFAAPQKWSAYEGVTFWLYWRERPACRLQVHLVEEGGGTYFAEVDLGAASGKWRQVVVPFRQFQFGAWSRDPNHRLDLDTIGTLALVGVAEGGSSRMYVDGLQLWRRLPK